MTGIEHLKTDEDIALYLSVLLADDDSSKLMHTLRVVAHALAGVLGGQRRIGGRPSDLAPERDGLI